MKLLTKIKILIGSIIFLPPALTLAIDYQPIPPTTFLDNGPEGGLAWLNTIANWTFAIFIAIAVIFIVRAAFAFMYTALLVSTGPAVLSSPDVEDHPRWHARL